MKGCVYSTRTVKQPSKRSVSYANGTLLTRLGTVVWEVRGRPVFRYVGVCVYCMFWGPALTGGESPFSTFIKGAFSIVTTTA